jgi:hypothetical protein
MKRDSKHKEIVIAFLQGSVIQVKNSVGTWLDSVEPLFLDTCEYRIKPVDDVVDLSKMVNSHIFCMFRDQSSSEWVTGKLLSIDGVTPSKGEYPYNTTSECYAMCKPLEDYWFANTGHAECPIPKGLKYEVQLRNGDLHSYVVPQDYADWDIGTANLDDLIQFRITGLCEGWVFPWSDNEE